MEPISKAFLHQELDKIPDDKNTEILRALQNIRSKSQRHEKNKLTNFLMSGPVWDDSAEKAIEEIRDLGEKWQTKSF